MPISEKEARAAGLQIKEIKPRSQSPWRKKNQPKKVDYEGDLDFDKKCEEYGLPLPESEYPFNKLSSSPARDDKGKIRPWRFDHLFGGLVAVEQIGGVWGVGKACKLCKRRRPGHHSYGKDQIDDMYRRNHAQLLGYIVLEFPPEDFVSGKAFEEIKKFLGLHEAERS